MSDCPHNENNTDYCSICLRAKIERLQARVAKLEADKCAWEACAQGHYEALSKANRRIAELEAEVKALWLEKIERDNVADSEVET